MTIASPMTALVTVVSTLPRTEFYRDAGRRFVDKIRLAFGDRRGIAAVEFAIILPLMLIMYIGVVDVTRGVMANRDADLLSRTISDLIAQQTTASPMASSTISTIFNTAPAIMVPFNTTSLTMTVSAVDVSWNTSTNSCCLYLVRWSYTQGGTLRACSASGLTPVTSSVPPSATNIPAAIGNANATAGFPYAAGQKSYIIVSDVTYTYSPISHSAWFGVYPGNIRKTTFMVPRSVTNPVTLASPVNPAAGQSGTICF